jgi:hypothetical protein
MKFILGTKDEENPGSLKEAINKPSGGLSNLKGFFQNKVNAINEKTNSIVEQTQNYQLGIFIMLTGFVILGVSLLFLPLVIIKPYKFCALNCLGTFTLFVSIVVMKGISVLKSMFSSKMVVITLMFFGTFFGELYFSVINERYIFVLVFCALHLISILYILLSFIPNGVGFLNTVFKTTWKFFKNILFKNNNNTLPI